MIRAGEVGGILEETLSYLADALEEEWRFSCRVEPREGWSGLLFASDQPPPADWADLSHSQQILTLFLFCRLLSDLLSSGIPTRLVIETVAELLPVAQREAVRAVAQADSWLRAAPLAQIGFLPAWVAELMLHGEQIGHLDAVMDKAAKVYRHQLQCEQM
jgi:type II secretory pathway component PulF